MSVDPGNGASLSTEQHLFNLIEAASAHLQSFKRPPYPTPTQAKYDSLQEAVTAAAAHLHTIESQELDN